MRLIEDIDHGDYLRALYWMDREIDWSERLGADYDPPPIPGQLQAAYGYFKSRLEPGFNVYAFFEPDDIRSLFGAGDSCP